MNAARLLQHFRRISEAPDAIRHIRRFILGLALRGKLFEQEPLEEDASQLLKRIRRDHGRGVKTEQADLRALEDSQMPFSAPPGWVWFCFG